MQFDNSQYDGATFEGAKLALYLGRDLVVILRDDRPDLIYANHWDLPGGGREGNETPLECALRECLEELGLRVSECAVVWGRAFREGPQVKWFFVAYLDASARDDIIFGDEGQGWQLMSEKDFLAHPRAVPAFQDRLSHYLRERDAWEEHAR